MFNLFLAMMSSEFYSSSQTSGAGGYYGQGNLIKIVTIMNKNSVLNHYKNKTCDKYKNQNVTYYSLLGGIVQQRPS